ncbi:protein abrupt isoform X3 [Aphidius gifuensis]|uniref:protein abrupt isoform X3 n=1 Tax=Aphidius gifuensis TaxID=684658 RepID=UPI001CDC1789|nr:protein abrupt isoform X3 [Aphidius gifuensis]XP_044004167.1 protein abrupt isoform X3 [Aphidius gifuensis]
MAASSSSSSGEQQYSLRWNDFQSSILSSFRHLRDEEDFIDVTLACDSSSFTAHKVVLSACSPYFRRLLKANPCQHPIVILRDVASSDMESLLRFMYHGEVHVGQEQLAAFLKTAQMLQVRGLADVNSSTAGTKDPPTTGSTGRDNGDSPIIPRNLWNDSSRNDPNDSGLSPPPEKRPRSYSPPVGNHLEHKNELQDSLLGQALEGGPTIHTTSNNIQAQSIGEDSNSMSENDEEMSNNDSILNSVKTEPNDLLNDSMEHHRNSFPAALLGLQGLMPGPSGIHAANQDPNYDDDENAVYHHHHRQSQRFVKDELMIEEEDYHDDGGSGGGGMVIKQPDNTTVLHDRLMQQHQHGFICPLCSKITPSIGDMRIHLDEHYPRDSSTCPVLTCRKTFTHPNSVRNHMRIKHGDKWKEMKALRWTYV